MSLSGRRKRGGTLRRFMDIIKESGGWWWWGFWYSGRGRWMIWDQCLLCWSLQGSNQRMEEVRTMSFYRNLQAKFSASQQQVVQISKVLLSFLCVWHICLQSRSKMICSRCKKKKCFITIIFFFVHTMKVEAVFIIFSTHRETLTKHTAVVEARAVRISRSVCLLCDPELCHV